jgi:hypothetical protein
MGSSPAEGYFKHVSSVILKTLERELAELDEQLEVLHTRREAVSHILGVQEQLTSVTGTVPPTTRPRLSLVKK